MKIFTWLSCIFVAVTSVSAQDTKVPPTELQIESTFKPDACPHQAQKGDRLWVHYVRRLTTCINPSVLMEEPFLDRNPFCQRKEIRL